MQRTSNMGLEPGCYGLATESGTRDGGFVHRTFGSCIYCTWSFLFDNLMNGLEKVYRHDFSELPVEPHASLH